MKIFEQFIIVVGLSGAGKTTFCSYLSIVSGLKTVNSGEALRNFLRVNNMQIQHRMETGDVFLNHFSDEQLYQAVYDYALLNDANIIDGIRLESTLAHFKANHENIVTIFIESEESIREKRFLTRLKQEEPAKELVEKIVSKKDSYFDEVMSLKKYADYIINNNHSDLRKQAATTWKNINQE